MRRGFYRGSRAGAVRYVRKDAKAVPVNGAPSHAEPEPDTQVHSESEAKSPGPLLEAGAPEEFKRPAGGRRPKKFVKGGRGEKLKRKTRYPEHMKQEEALAGVESGKYFKAARPI